MPNIEGMKSNELVLLAETRRMTASGEALKIRQASGLSQGDFAKAVGVTVPTISRWENNDRAPRGEAALMYGRLLRQLRRSAGTAKAS